RLLQLFKDRLHFRTDKRHESIRKRLQEWSSHRRRTSEQHRCVSRLSLPNPDCTEHHPAKQSAWTLLSQPENGATTPNFDIVGMGSQAQNGQWFSAFSLQIQLDHRATDTSSEVFEVRIPMWFQTFHGAALWFSSSRCCLSLKVSMHC